MCSLGAAECLASLLLLLCGCKYNKNGIIWVYFEGAAVECWLLITGRCWTLPVIHEMNSEEWECGNDCLAFICVSVSGI
jgi:hypothetical protein